MLEANLSNFLEKLWGYVSQVLNECLGVFESMRELIIEHFGHNGLVAAYIVLTVMAVVLISRLAKISLATVKYLIVPALAFVMRASSLTIES